MTYGDTLWDSLEPNSAACLVRQAAEELPNDSQEIAALFLTRGVTGSRINAATCPIATYLNTAIDKTTHYTMATRDWIYLYTVDGSELGGPVMRTPYGVADFIRLFDGQAFPLLTREITL